jgi:hypothetical protein
MVAIKEIMVEAMGYKGYYREIRIGSNAYKMQRRRAASQAEL